MSHTQGQLPTKTVTHKDSHAQRQSPSRSPLEASGIEGNAQSALAGTEEGSRSGQEAPEEDPEEDLESDRLCG